MWFIVLPNPKLIWTIPQLNFIRMRPQIVQYATDSGLSSTT